MDRQSWNPEISGFKGSADRVLLLSEAALLTGLSTKTLKRLACEVGGPKLFKLSPRRVAIRSSELENWINSRVATGR
jgi:predicted DNA-binding transcriptional regulator AlpA